MSDAKRLKILFITAWYPTKEQPVAGVFVREHAKAAQMYHDVVVLHCPPGNNPNMKKICSVSLETDENLTEGIPTYRVKHGRFPAPKSSHIVYVWSVLQAFRSIAAQGFRPDVIHAHIYKAAVPAILVGKLNRIPVVITEQSSYFPRKLLTALHTWLARISFKRANMVMPVSRALQRSIESYGIKAQFQVVPNVVDTSLFFPGFSLHSKSSFRRLLSVCLYDRSHNKGVPYLLHALAKLKQRRDDWHLDLVGDGPARSDYEQLVKDLGLAEKVTFHGIKSKPEVAEFMRRVDIFVLPSLFETFSVVVIEALASGKPVLATQCGGPEDFVTDDVGILVPPGDADALCEGLNRMLDKLGLYSSENISQYAVERFSPAAVGAKIHAVYQSLV